jgi:hypothetical protein
MTNAKYIMKFAVRVYGSNACSNQIADTDGTTIYNSGSRAPGFFLERLQHTAQGDVESLGIAKFDSSAEANAAWLAIRWNNQTARIVRIRSQAV